MQVVVNEEGKGFSQASIDARTRYWEATEFTQVTFDLLDENFMKQFEYDKGPVEALSAFGGLKVLGEPFDTSEWKEQFVRADTAS